ncbi:phosphotransferase enzyme family protein [Cordyceps fumosorosea ARSEF 2679]|uniref:Phosphotransferase enzyme family protein n=1 Tax=Cordyceps fumosorosea (strain ARSEF 2679) TaxID=1081104 RepID=A0A167SXK0_CORFA|nr:phosphotransferase enzyme family protein [Cordyceps fumosorosea ARSEF 2679]OAA60033.1 phosphotransferase enzyme family protein [Cordyceps fumosorosea ARSEF 2679]
MGRLPQFNDVSVAARVQTERLRFIASIKDADVLRLATSQHSSKHPCTFFRPAIHGSYNVCYFVKFPTTGERWTVRIPIRPCLAHGGRSKLASEVTTMNFLKAHADIPIPTIRAHSLDGTNSPLSRYLILDYMEGTQLSSVNIQLLDKEKRNQLYLSLAKILVQLRRLTFPSFGRLYLAGGDELRVANEIVTKDINIQELEDLDPRRIQRQCYGERDFLPTASHYMETLMRTAYNAFFKGADSVDPDMIDSSLYHLDLFRQHAALWADPKISPVQFVLSHGDLSPENILVDEQTMAVTAVLDWGWSRVVPVQLLTPPLWLGGADDVALLAWRHAYDGYVARDLGDFLAVVRAEERRKYRSSVLADQWDRGRHDGGFLIAHALESWRDMDAVAFRYLNMRHYGGTADLEARVARFLEDDPLRGLVVDMKARQARRGEEEGVEEGEGGRHEGGRTMSVGSRAVSKLWPSRSALQGSMMIITTGVGYGLWRLALASARRPPRI